MEKTVDLLTAAQLRVLAMLQPDQPVVMLNLLRFRETARYDDPLESCTGREAYRRYSQIATRTIASVDGSIIFGGKASESLIGPADEIWHQVFLVKYPSPSAFRAMLSMPEYQAAVTHTVADRNNRVG